MAKHTPGARLHRARKRLGLTEAALAEKVGTTQTTIHRLEKDAGRAPRAALALAIERETGIPAVSWFAARLAQSQ